ncbi:MAG: fimbrillin family protein [Prevotellaceae bacterium]|nr:fimbrillin family protein [Prevotellaceae bacterium]
MKSKMNYGQVKFLSCLQMMMLAMLWIGCERDVDEDSALPSYKNKQMVSASFTASMTGDNPSLRSGVIYGNMDIAAGESFIWHENDKIGVFGVNEKDSIVMESDGTPSKGYVFDISNYSNEKASGNADFVGFIPSGLLGVKKLLAVSGLEYSTITYDMTKPNFRITHTNPMQVGTSTSHLSEMDFMYSVSDTMVQYPLRVANYVLPSLSMKHISSLLRYHVVNETQSDWRVMRVEVSALDTATGNPSDAFYSSCYIQIDIPNDMLMDNKSWASVTDMVSLSFSESETDKNGMKLAAESSIDGYQMVIPTEKLSKVNLRFTVVLSSSDGKTIKTCTPLVLAGEKIRNEKFESGYRYAFGLKITDELLSSSVSTELLFPGSGTADDPFVISDGKGLSDIRDLINMGSAQYLNAYYKLKGDVNLPDSVNWEPIASDPDKPFNGVFDGDGSSISHLTYNNPTSSLVHDIALFGYLGEDAVVRDLYINNVSFNGNMTSSAAIASLNKGTIIGCCINSGNIGDAATKGSTIGGLVAVNEGSIQKSCCSADVSGAAFSGCLVGKNRGSIVACYTSGNFNGVTKCNIQSGFVGFSESGSSIVACCSRGGTISCSYSGGGLVCKDEAGAYLVGSYATGNVTLSSSTGKNVGSLVGILKGEMAYCATPNNVGLAGYGIGSLASDYVIGCEVNSSNLYSVVTSVPETYNGGVAVDGTVVVDGEVYSLGRAPGKSIWKNMVMPKLFWE